MVSRARAGFGAALGKTLILSLYWKRMNKAGGMAGILAVVMTIVVTVVVTVVI
ncbi:sodium:solute symporter family transporter [Amphritea balenae]|uniref:sodium:solute symporter family transporter n=1 Tax=Amphritea balenae TaxID=452629 RepID=UPI001B86BE63